MTFDVGADAYDRFVTRSGKPGCVSAAVSCCRQHPFTPPALAWAARGVA